MTDRMDEPQEVTELERTAAWRLRLVDADPGDASSAAAAQLLEKLAEDLRRSDYAALWTELRSIGNWLGELDAISDFADLAADYRMKVGVSEHPADGADYLHGLLAIGRDLIG